jgi:hypothetical protein
MALAIEIRKGDLVIMQPFADDQEEEKIRAIFRGIPESENWDQLFAWQMELAHQHAAELGLPEGFSHDDLMGITFGFGYAD